MAPFVFCGAHGNGVVLPLAQAWAQQEQLALQLLDSTVPPEAQLHGAAQGLLVVPAAAELVDWVGALAACRLPTLLALAGGERLGAEAALHQALLAQRRVPLLGLLQVGGDWQPQQRRLEGLPWLGCWQPGDRDGLLALRPLLGHRLRLLDLA
ncbi:MAG: hypothetical protein RLZZ158_1183 [Cyanobacteriota bacterium]|jgi:hypothetical protein